MKVCAKIIIFCLIVQFTNGFESSLWDEKVQQKASDDFKVLRSGNKNTKEMRSSPSSRSKRQVCNTKGLTSRLEKQVGDCLDANRGFQTSINELVASFNSISTSQLSTNGQSNCHTHTKRLKEINENLLSEVFNKFGPTCKLMLGLYRFFLFWIS